MKISELRYGQRFTFPSVPRSVYVARGNGWYGSTAGYDGGPWHTSQDTEVNPCDTIDDQWQTNLDYIAENGPYGK